MSDFFITLPSNSNYNLFPNNSVTDYTVNFNRPLPIDETFEIALVECHFPYDVDSSLETTADEDVVTLMRAFTYTDGRIEYRTVRLPLIPKKWNDKQDLVEEINHLAQCYLEHSHFKGNIPFLKYVHGNLHTLD